MAVFLLRSLYLLPLIFFVGAKAQASTNYNGSWEVVSANSGVSAMHLVMQPPTNKILMFDATVFGPSQIKLAPGVECPSGTWTPDNQTMTDCYSHAVSFDIDNASVRPLKVLTDPWCSAGGITVDGTVVNIGGWNDGERGTRGFSVPIPTIVAGWKAEANPTTYNGSWEVVSANSGVSAMHLVMQPPTNKILMFDATVFGPSQILLPFGVECRTFPCYSHAVSFNTDDASVRPLKVLTDPWCSAGGITVDGTVVNVGGWNDGERATRWLSSCTTSGSNTNNGYNLTVTPGIGKYPTDMRVEKFWPPYLDPLLTDSRPQIVEETAPTNIKYGDNLQLDFTLGQDTLKEEELEVTLYYPPFTTHGFSMSQRLLMLAKTEVVTVGYWSYQVQALAPPSNVIAPSGYYLLFVVYRGVPSPGVWIHIQ
ncbi:hypothetical protein NE237_028113 [Protea cynaroides]|uniref:Galactose oxidase-like Early set domain-containing protein n=1 Tax=Protea cynaroides TaxID=273540 RepID=A0A9Q0GQJ8_9MAGN|nr:hypothetical protein NE237_028113 [Protea cynaroides]